MALGTKLERMTFLRHEEVGCLAAQGVDRIARWGEGRLRGRKERHSYVNLHLALISNTPFRKKTKQRCRIPFSLNAGGFGHSFIHMGESDKILVL